MTDLAHVTRWTTLALSLSLTACAASPASAPLPTPEQPLNGLDSYIEQAVEEWGIAGLAIAIVDDDSIVFAEGYGVRDVRTGEPVDENTVFAIGSNSKLFTSVSTGMLVDEGVMDWSDRATEHLPAFQLYDPYVTREIRIRDLLSHRSGLGRRGDLLWYGSDLNREEILRQIRYLEPNSSFRSEFGYQNIMFLAAGEALANAAGTTWDDFVEQNIFTPLGMERSTTSPVPLEQMQNVAQPHVNEDGQLIPVPYRNIDNVAPAGSINSSVIDMAQWLRMLLNEGTYEGQVLVDTATLAEIMSPHTIMGAPSDSLFPSTHFLSYGMGIVVQDYRGAKVGWHTGGIDGMLSLVALLPEEEVGVVILTNSMGHNNLFTALMYRVLDAYLGAPPRDWSGIFLDQTLKAEAGAAERALEAEAARVTGTTPSLPLAQYVGTYSDEMYGDLEIRQGDGGLTLHKGSTFVADLEHWHYNTFKANWRDGAGLVGDVLSTIVFELNARAEVESLEIPGLEDFERVDDEEG